MINELSVTEEGLVGVILELGPLSQRQLQAACHFETFGLVSWCTATPVYSYSEGSRKDKGLSLQWARTK